MTDESESIAPRLTPRRRPKARQERISVRVTSEQRQRFERAARRNGRTLANWLRWLGDTASKANGK
jgi:hypothetical protein